MRRPIAMTLDPVSTAAPVKCHHTDGPEHDCEYVDKRNALVPKAAAIASRTEPQENTGRWTAAYMNAMNQLAIESGLVKPHAKERGFWDVAKEVLKRAAVFVLLAGLLGTAACKTDSSARGDGSSGSKIVSCATESVRRSWPTAYPHVQHCLTGIMDSPMACLDALPSAIGVAIETVACIVRDAGKAAAAQQGQNPDDVVSVRKAERANAWLDSRGYMFQ